MRIAIILAASLCILTGCKIESGTTTITNVSIDGKAGNVMRSYVNGDSGDFECIKSISGRCHYLLFVKDCGAGATGRRAGNAAATARCRPSPSKPAPRGTWPTCRRDCSSA